MVACGTELNWGWCGSFSCFISWLDNWQTMLTGIGAIAAAAISVHYLRKQIEEASHTETARRRRRLAATRSRLQMALSEISQFSTEAIGLIKRYIDAISAGQPTESLTDLPRPLVPEAAVLALEAVIEATDDELFGKFQHGFALALLVTHGDRLAAPLRRVAGPLGKAVKAPDIGLAVDLDIELSRLLGSRHSASFSPTRSLRRLRHPPPATHSWRCVAGDYSSCALRLSDL
jgi:hypothetical protein